MKLNILVYKNLTLGASANPKYESEEPEKVAEMTRRSVIMAKPEEVAHLTNTELYFLGTYDDETMEFNLESSPVLLIDFNKLLDERKVRLAILAQVQKAREEKAEKGEGNNVN